MKTCSLTIRLEERLGQELEAPCVETDRSRDDTERNALRRRALPFGEAAGWFTDVDVFVAISWAA